MVLYFIRHGQSANNALWAATGGSIGRSIDPELTEKGKMQAAAVGEQLLNGCEAFPYEEDGAEGKGNYGITHLYASPMIRALDTGTIIARRLGLTLQCKSNFHETGGIFNDDRENKTRSGQPGNTGAQLKTRFPDVKFNGIKDDEGWWNRPYEESGEWAPRARAIINELIRNHQGTKDRVAIITHGGIFHEIVSEILQIPRENKTWFSMCNCGITRIEEVDSIGEENFTMAIAYSNSFTHLPADLRS